MTTAHTVEPSRRFRSPTTPRGVPRGYVPRQRLADRLDSGAHVTLVVSPAGTGKSTAIAAWCATSSTPTIWADVERGAPCTALWAALGEAFGIATSTEVPGSDPREVRAGDLVVGLTDHMATSLTSAHVLVIDGLDVDDDDMLAALALFVRRLPPALRLVISSRHALPLPFDQLRLRGELDEIGFDDLRFTPGESDALLRELDVGSDFAREVITWADGWAAPLAFGAITWRERRAPGTEMDAVQRLLRDYVVHELLRGESDGFVQFLIDIAVVATVAIPLANAISGDASGAERLDRAEDRGVFVSSVGIRGWYEMHPAVRSVLVHEAERRDPERLRACRTRAAGWLEQNGETVAAIEQWLHAGEPRAALRLLAERHVELYDAGLASTVESFVGRITELPIDLDLGDMVALTWCQLLTSREAFLRGTDDALWWAEHASAASPCERSARQLRGLLAVAALVQGDLERCRTSARQALDGFSGWSDDAVLRTIWNVLARTVALDERWDDTHDDVREISVMVRHVPVRSFVLDVTRALGLSLAGRPVDALRVTHRLRASSLAGALTMSRAELDLADVIAHRELADAPDAEAELTRLVALELPPCAHVRGAAALELVQLHLDHGAVGRATSAFHVLEQLVHDELPGPMGSLWLGRMGTVLALERGDHDRAWQWAREIADPFWGPISRARVGGDHVDVTETLADAVPRCPRHEVILAMLQAAATPDVEHALGLAERAATTASTHGMVQTLGTTRQLDLIERVAWRLPAPWMDRLRRLIAGSTSHSDVEGHLVEPLTVRERDVLRFLPSRLTLREIAEELYVSVNTLKFHLRVIYRKLGVNSRAEAAEVFRSWNRIERD